MQALTAEVLTPAIKQILEAANTINSPLTQPGFSWMGEDALKYIRVSLTIICTALAGKSLY